MPLSPPVTIATLPASRPKRDFGSGLRSRLARVIIFPETVRNVRKGMNALQRLLVRPRLPLRSIPPPAPMGAGVKALLVEVIRVGRVLGLAIARHVRLKVNLAAGERPEDRSKLNSEESRVGKKCVSTC